MTSSKKKLFSLTFLMMIVPVIDNTISTRHVHIAAKAAGVALMFVMEET